MAVESYGDIFVLPVDCVANTLSLTTPKDACRLSVVGSTFRSAAQSDGVWERFLPSDYRDIISLSIDGPNSLLDKFQSKKDLYFHLCEHPILIEAGLKSFTLEKWSGKKCYMLAARALFIVWGDTSRYWHWMSLPESRFSEVAQLIDVCWLEIRGKINTKMLSSGRNYAAYLVFTIKTRLHGFVSQHAEAYMGMSGHEMDKRIICLDPACHICLDPDGAQSHRYQIVPLMGLFYYNLAHIQRQQDNVAMDSNTECPKQREDGWMEVELGEYFVKEGEDGSLEMSLMEVKGGVWKSGLIIQGIEIRPKKCV